jgi:hypothetical protein
MDEITLIAASACVALCLLVYLMWRSATQSGWQDLTQKEKRRWRNEEERLKDERGK